MLEKPLRTESAIFEPVLKLQILYHNKLAGISQ